MRSALDRGCGGIRRAFEPPGDGGLVDHRLAPVREMCRRCAPHLAQHPNKAGRMDRACELNVELQLRRIAATPILRGACSASNPSPFTAGSMAWAMLRDLGLKLSSLDEAETLDREDNYAGRRVHHHGSSPRRGSLRGVLDAGAAAIGGGLRCRT